MENNSKANKRTDSEKKRVSNEKEYEKELGKIYKINTTVKKKKICNIT